MSALPVLLGQFQDDQILSYWFKSSASRNALGIFFGAVTFVTLVVIAWAAFIRKPAEDRPRRYIYPNSSSASGNSLASEQPSNGTPSSPRTGKKRKRRRRRGHRSRNPTLAETGGLPPVRHDVPTDDPP